VVRYPQTDGIPLAFQDPGYLTTGRQHKGERARNMLLQQPEGGGTDAPGIPTEIGEIITDKGELGFLRINPLQTANTFHSPGLLDITSKTIHRIRRIDDDTARSEAVNDLFNQTRLRVNRMDMNDHDGRFN
jgi:hypothetical protein